MIEIKFNEKTLKNAVKNNDTETVSKCLKANVIPNACVARQAARKGNIEVLKLFLKAGLPANQCGIDVAATRGNFNIVELLIENGAKFIEYDTLSCVVRNNMDLNCAEVIIENLSPTIKVSALKNALEDCSLDNETDKVKYLLEKGANISEDAVNYAAENANLECLKNLIEAGAKVTDETLKFAVIGGNLEMVNYMLDELNIIPKIEHLLEAAEEAEEAEDENKKNSIKILKTLMIAANMDSVTKSMNRIAAYGNTKKLEIFIEAGANPAQKALECAVRKGLSEMVDFLLEQCKIKPNTEILNIAVQNRDDYKIIALIQAGAKPSQETLENYFFCNTAQKYNDFSLEIAKKIIESGAPISPRAIKCAISCPKPKKLLTLIFENTKRLTVNDICNLLLYITNQDAE